MHKKMVKKVKTVEDLKFCIRRRSFFGHLIYVVSEISTESSNIAMRRLVTFMLEPGGQGNKKNQVPLCCFNVRLSDNQLQNQFKWSQKFSYFYYLDRVVFTLMDFQ